MLQFHELGKRRARVGDPLTGIRLVPARVLRMARRERQAEKYFVLDQRRHIQFLARLDAVGRVGIFRIFAHVLARAHQQQRAGKLERIIERPKTALALQAKIPADIDLEHQPALRVPSACHHVLHFAIASMQAVVQPRKHGDRNAASQLPCRAGELQTIDDSLCRHKARMIVFLRHAVKEKAQTLQALTR